MDEEEDKADDGDDNDGTSGGDGSDSPRRSQESKRFKAVHFLLLAQHVVSTYQYFQQQRSGVGSAPGPGPGSAPGPGVGSAPGPGLGPDVVTILVDGEAQTPVPMSALIEMLDRDHHTPFSSLYMGDMLPVALLHRDMDHHRDFMLLHAPSPSLSFSSSASSSSTSLSSDGLTNAGGWGPVDGLEGGLDDGQGLGLGLASGPGLAVITTARQTLADSIQSFFPIALLRPLTLPRMSVNTHTTNKTPTTPSTPSRSTSTPTTLSHD